MPWFQNEQTQDTHMGGFSPEGEPETALIQVIVSGLRNAYLTAAGQRLYSCSVMSLGENPVIPDGVVMGIALDSPALPPRIRELALEIIAIQDAHHTHSKTGESN